MEEVGLGKVVDKVTEKMGELAREISNVKYQNLTVKYQMLDVKYQISKGERVSGGSRQGDLP